MNDNNTSSKTQSDGIIRIFLDRARKHSSLIIGLFLTIPILLLYLIALNSLDRKGTFLLVTITTITVFFVGALSLDLEVGSMGLPNFGKVAFFAIGAYISTLLYSEYDVPFHIAVIVALILSGLVGFAVAIPTVKLRADYFAIMTIAGGEVVRLIFQNEQRWLWSTSEWQETKTQVISNKLRIEFSGSFPFNQRISEFLESITILEDIGSFIEELSQIVLIPVLKDIPIIKDFLHHIKSLISVVGTSIKYKTMFTDFGTFIEELSQLLLIPVLKDILIIKEILDFIKTFVSIIGSTIKDISKVFLWQMTILIIFIVISLMVFWFVEFIRKSPYGRTLRAIREDDISVTSVGKDVARFRWQVTTLAALIAGLAGVMYAMTYSSFEAGEFRPFLTFNLYIFIIIGGLGNSKGAFAGTTLVTLFLHGAGTQAVKEVITMHLGPDGVTLPEISFFGIDFSEILEESLSPIFGPLFQLLRIDVFITPENTAIVVLGAILILFLLFKPDGLIPEPKTDTEQYLSLLTAEQRERSDAAVLARQSLGEKERLQERTEGEPPPL